MQGFSSTPVSSGPKPQPSRTGGIAAGSLLARCPLSAAQARTQFNLVHKKWSKEGYSVIGTIFFVGLDKAGSSEWLQHRCPPEIRRSLGLQPPRARGPVLQRFQHVFGNCAQRRFDSVRDVLLQTFQRVATNRAIRARTAAQFQNPSQRAARVYTSCFAVLNSKERKELREENKEDGDSRPLDSSPRCFGIQQEDASRQTTTHEIPLLGGHAFKFPRT